MRPLGPETSSSTTFARRSMSGRTTLVPVNWSHSSADSESGSARTRTVVRQVPISQSKSRWPSATDDAGAVAASPDAAIAISMRAERPATRIRLYGTVMVRLSERSTAMSKKAPAGNPSRPNPLPGCPMAAAFAAIGGKWKLTLLYWLAHGESHFAGLRRRGAPITPKVLAEQLRELEADGLVERVVTGPVPAPRHLPAHSLRDHCPTRRRRGPGMG